MKKILLFIFGIIITLTLLSCNNHKSELKKESISAAQRAIDLADEYLDFKIEGEDANRELSNMYYRLNSRKEVSHEDKMVTTDILLLDSSILNDTFSHNRYDSILKHRNSLAERIGEEIRE